jgi:hypothetical protein
LNKTGDVEWAKGFPGTGGSGGQKESDIIPLADGGFSIISGAGGVDGWIVRLTDGGDIIWQKGYLIEEVWGGYFTHGVKLKEGGYAVVGGAFHYWPGPPYQIWILKVDENGEVIWGKGYKTGNEGIIGDLISEIKELPSGNLITTGMMAIPDLLLFVLNLNPDGTTLWQKAYGPVAGLSIEPLPDNGYIVAGLTSFGAGNGDFWVLKLLPDGTCPPLGVDYNFISHHLTINVSETNIMPISITPIVRDVVLSVEDTHALVMQQAP